MSRTRKFLIIILAAVASVLLCLAVTACAKKSFDPDKYPDFVNAPNAGPSDSDNTDDRYIFYTRAKNGMSIDNVQISLLVGNTVIMTGISVDGRIDFVVDPGVYNIRYDSVPLGYSTEDEDLPTATTATEKKVTANFPSKVIETTMPAGHSYSTGDVMYNFQYATATGEVLDLRDLMQDKKLVVLNFFFVSCSPCQREFPGINTAYGQLDEDIELIAISNRDSRESIENFRTTNDYSFKMVYDSQGLTSAFNVSSFPTTVFIDRYGIVAGVHTGNNEDPNYWLNSFNGYLRDDYEYTPPATGEGDGGAEVTERPKPNSNLTMPTSADFNAAVSPEGFEFEYSAFTAETSDRDKEISWPWLLDNEGDRDYMYPSGSGAGTDYAFSPIYIKMRLEYGQALSFDYNVISENYSDAGPGDVLYLLLNGSPIWSYQGNSNGWQTESNIYIAGRTEELTFAFAFNKDNLLTEEDEHVYISNITVTDVTSSGDNVDVRVPLVGMGSDSGSFIYSEEENIKLENGYYYLYEDGADLDGSIILADLIGLTMWTDEVFGANTFINPENATVQSTLYLISFWLFNDLSDDGTDEGDGGFGSDESENQGKILFEYTHNVDLDALYTDAIIDNYYMQQFSDNGLVPLTPDIRDAIEAFITAYYRDYSSIKGLTEPKIPEDENQWQMFCYTYVHNGPDKTHGAQGWCNETNDPVKGMDFSNALTITEGVTKVDNYRGRADNAGGVYYKFVAPQTGAYSVESLEKKDINSSVDPAVWLWTEDGELIDSQIESRDYDKVRDVYLDFNLYFYAEADQIIYIQCSTRTPGDVSDYSIDLKYIDEEAWRLLIATTGDGAYTTQPDGSLPLIYISVEAYEEGGVYYHYVDGATASPIYIDFIHNNYYNYSTLYAMIEAGVFDFSAGGGADFTPTMMEYYETATQKPQTDPTYGMVEANTELVDIIAGFITQYDEDGDDATITGAWKAFACYYEYYGADSWKSVPDGYTYGQPQD